MSRKVFFNCLFNQNVTVSFRLRFNSHRNRAIANVNIENLLTCWDVGQYISLQLQYANWGNKVVMLCRRRGRVTGECPRWAIKLRKQSKGVRKDTLSVTSSFGGRELSTPPMLTLRTLDVPSMTLLRESCKLARMVYKPPKLV